VLKHVICARVVAEYAARGERLDHNKPWSWNMTTSKKISGRRCLFTSSGFSLIEVMLVVMIISILSATASYFFSTMRQKACITIARYDLRKFFEAEQVYLSEHNAYIGSVGDVISNAPGIESTFTVEGYSPSKNTYITITNDDPLTAQARQLGIEVIFECDILTGLITER
jgi:prepilin-type N-terminal cleavage/methylation domain-containing protein